MPTLNTKPPKDKTKKDRKSEALEIYNSPIWKGLRLQRLISHPICEKCGKSFATEVHHIKPFMSYYGYERLVKAYDPENLMALCGECHKAQHQELRDKKKRQFKEKRQ